jgi:hypothetical protein
MLTLTIVSPGTSAVLKGRDCRKILELLEHEGDVYVPPICPVRLRTALRYTPAVQP